MGDGSPRVEVTGDISVLCHEIRSAAGEHTRAQNIPINHWCPMAYTLNLTRWCPMEYKKIVQTVVETPTYLAMANKLFSEEERADIVALVAADPECGDVIRGTGGFRKVRVARKGMGKSGGARVVYIWRNERFPVFLITVFPKNEKENLSMAERNALKKRADSIFETYGG